MAKSATSHISQTSVEHILTLSPLHDSEHIRALPGCRKREIQNSFIWECKYADPLLSPIMERRLS